LTDVDPKSGSGSSGTFTVRFSDPNSLTDFAWGQVLFNQSLAGASGCYIHWEHEPSMIYLQNDKAEALLGPATPGQRAVLENAQCRLEIDQVAVSRTPDSVTLTIPIQFKKSFRGRKNIYLRAADRSGHTLDWKSVAVWDVR
jgi:hypothetical protein